MKGIVFSAAAAVMAVLLGQPAIAATGQTNCKLGNGIKHIVYIQFDNVHLRRDNPNVPSDLEQMPNLLNFLEDNGTIFTNHYTPLISHTAVDILTSLTGVYGDKFGLPIGNSLRRFNPDGTTSGVSSFAYWTDPVDIFSGEVPANPPPQMIDQRGKIHPAPWVPFARAGCDVGAFSVANIEFENIGIDVTTVFGAGSPEENEAKSDPTMASADFLGIAVHCAQKSPLCAPGKPDLLADEPLGYVGFKALFGNKYVQPQISPGGPVTDIDGNIIQDARGNPGFPNLFNPSAAQTLGYVATMLEAGVPVVYAYISDAHDNNHFTGSGTFGPGEAGYVQQLADYNQAFGKFFDRLEKDGITKDDTLFVITADENDHFAGGPPSPANCDGVTSPCTYAKIGEIDADLSLVFATEFGDTTPFSVHSDDAPTFYITGNPGQTDTVTRKLEREAGALLGFDTLVGPSGSTNKVTQALADQAEQALLHMITADPGRTPNFILFGNPDYFLSASGKTTPLCTPANNAASCFVEGPGFAWNHGDFQNQITYTWLGMVGRGVLRKGRFGEIFSDHTDIRPTMLSLAKLKDDYAHDGRVLFEALDGKAIPDSLQDHRDTLSDLAEAYKAINAPRGALGARTLTGISTTALKGDDATYARLEARIEAITTRRNQIAGKMIDMLEDAAFEGEPIDEAEARRLIDRAYDLLDSVR